MLKIFLEPTYRSPMDDPSFQNLILSAQKLGLGDTLQGLTALNNTNRLLDIVQDQKLASNFRSWWPSYLNNIVQGDQTLLLWAIDKKYNDLAIAVIKKLEPVHLEAKNNKGQNALMLALDAGLTDIALALINKMEPESFAAKYDRGETALMSGVRQKRIDITLRLIDKMHPADLALKNNDGNTALHIGCEIERPESQLVHPLIAKMNVGDLSLRNNRNLMATNYDIPFFLSSAINGRLNQPAPIVMEIANAIATEPSTAQLLADPKELIERALTSGRSSDALSVGTEILSACTEFFSAVQKKSAESLMQGMEASTKIADLTQRIAETKAELEKLLQNPELLISRRDLFSPLRDLLYKIFPDQNPRRVLEGDFDDIDTSIKTALSSSQSVMKAYEDFRIYAPEIENKITALIENLEAAVAKIDAEIEPPLTEGESTPPLSADQKEDKTRLRRIFETIHGNAAATRNLIRMNMQTTGMNLDTEVEFSTQVLPLRTVLDVTITNASTMIASMKPQATAALTAQSRNLIRDQLEEVKFNLERMAVVAEMRQQKLQPAASLSSLSSAPMPIRAPL